MSDNKEVILVKSNPDKTFIKHTILGIVYKGDITKEDLKEIVEML